MNQYKHDPLVIVMLEMRAKTNAIGQVVGTACEGNVKVRYYPRSDRYAWFNENGSITKRYAKEQLRKEGCI